MDDFKPMIKMNLGNIAFKDLTEPPIKGEGDQVHWMSIDGPLDGAEAYSKPEVPYTYVERRIPLHLEDACEAAIDQFLIDNGYDPKEM